VEKGLIATDAVDAVVDVFENEIGPRNGAGWWPGPGRPGLQGRGFSPTPRPRRRAGHRRARGRARGGGREHRHGPQRGRLHAVLVLPVAAAGHPAGLVQEPALPLARGQRAPAVLSELGLDVPPRSSCGCGTRAPRSATWWSPSARRHRRAVRGRARRPRHPRRHDRRRPRCAAHDDRPPRRPNPNAPNRTAARRASRSTSLAGRAFALAVTTSSGSACPGTPSATAQARRRRRPDRPYWESWLAALEDLAATAA
jgi:hypothetical protein